MPKTFPDSCNAEKEMTNEEIALVNRLEEINKGDFAQSLVSQFRVKGSLSPRQIFFVAKLVREIDEPKPMHNAGKIAELFTIAADGGQGRPLARPKIRLDTDSGRPVVFALSRNGRIYVGDGEYGGRKFGVISGSEFQEGPHCTEEVLSLVKKFADNPLAVAVASGKLSGYCVFCNKALSVDKSVEMGYGKVCAQNWGLEW